MMNLEERNIAMDRRSIAAPPSFFVVLFEATMTLIVKLLLPSVREKRSAYVVKATPSGDLPAWVGDCEPLDADVHGDSTIFDDLSIDDAPEMRECCFHSLPFTWEVCPTCSGKGKVVPPSIDAGGLTQEDFAADPDFAESYFAGHYDVSCPECLGRRVTPQVNLDACNKVQKLVAKKILRQIEEEEADRRQQAHEAAMGW